MTDLGEKKERMIGKLIAGELDDHIIQRAIEKIDCDSLEKEILLDKLNGEETGMTEFLDFGMTLLTHLGDFYSKGSPKTKRKLLSSILSEKLELRGKKYRTPTLKTGFNHIYQSINTLEARRKKKGEPNEELSLSVPGAGLEPARPYGPTDFKSVVSTNSTIRAEPRSSKRKMEKRSRSAQNTSVVTPSGSRPNAYPSKPSQQTGHWFRIAGRWTANFHPYPGDTPAGRPYQVASLRRA